MELASVKRRLSDENTNFWISYADLMAGLLFVFILLIGAIVTKSILLKSDLLSNKSRLKKNKTELELKNDEIKRLKKLLLEKNTQLASFSKKVIILQNVINDVNASLLEKERELKDFEGKVLVLSNELTDTKSKVELRDKEIVKLLNELGEKETRYDRLVADLRKTKKRIKSLTGIRIKVIAELKKALGNKIEIDPKTGSMRFSASILFDKAKAKLKDNAKAELKKVFLKYIKALLNNKDIKEHLDKIIIEGHTDSDGGFLYNLQLSQKRAYEVMNYLLTLDFVKKHNLKKIMIASGRSYLDPILDKNGVEDKDKSRRIEIKFTLKNQDAMKEIEKILDEK